MLCVRIGPRAVSFALRSSSIFFRIVYMVLENRHFFFHVAEALLPEWKFHLHKIRGIIIYIFFILWIICWKTILIINIIWKKFYVLIIDLIIHVLNRIRVLIIDIYSFIKLNFWRLWLELFITFSEPWSTPKPAELELLKLMALCNFKALHNS